MATSKIIKENAFRGADGSRSQDFGTNTSITPTKDGWLRVSFTTEQTQTIPPVVTVAQNNQVVGYGQGLTTANTTASMFIPVKAGLTYIVTIYRCALASIILFY